MNGAAVMSTSLRQNRGLGIVEMRGSMVIRPRPYMARVHPPLTQCICRAVRRSQKRSSYHSVQAGHLLRSYYEYKILRSIYYSTLSASGRVGVANYANNTTRNNIVQLARVVKGMDWKPVVISRTSSCPANDAICSGISPWS